jgi:hypothetical protein
MEFLPREIMQALHEAEARKAARRTRLRIVSGADSWPVLRRWRGGVALDAAQVSHLRGLVELHEGSRHIATLLIVASEIEGGELICAVKRETRVTDRAALDFVRAPDAPVGYLPPA